jgi:hypothetical protein
MSSRGTPSTEETDILRARSHGMDEFFGSVIPHQNAITLPEYEVTTVTTT